MLHSRVVLSLSYMGMWMIGILAIEEVQRLLLLNFTVVSKQPADFFCASSAAEDSLQPPAGRRSQLHTEPRYNLQSGFFFFFFWCFMAVWQTNENGALPPPTDLECGVCIGLEERNTKGRGKKQKEIKQKKLDSIYCSCVFSGNVI